MGIVNPTLYSAFVVTMFFMAMTPGPAVIYCIRTGLKGERLPVLAAVAGLNLGSLVWFAAAALGLGIVLASFPWIFPIIAVLGGLYLIYISGKSFVHALDISHEGIKIGAGFLENAPQKRFLEGITVQVLNPKAILFFTAVLPPFIDRHHPIPQQLGVFAATTVSMDVICMTAYGFLALRLAQFLETPKNKQIFDLGVSAILCIIGLMITFHSLRDLVVTVYGG